MRLMGKIHCQHYLLFQIPKNQGYFRQFMYLIIEQVKKLSCMCVLLFCFVSFSFLIAVVRRFPAVQPNEVYKLRLSVI